MEIASEQLKRLEEELVSVRSDMQKLGRQMEVLAKEIQDVREDVGRKTERRRITMRGSRLLVSAALLLMFWASIIMFSVLQLDFRKEFFVVIAGLLVGAGLLRFLDHTVFVVHDFRGFFRGRRAQDKH